MQGWLHRVPPGTLIMCHPAKALDAQDTISPARMAEYRYLLSADFASLLGQEQVQLVRGHTLYTPAP